MSVFIMIVFRVSVSKSLTVSNIRLLTYIVMDPRLQAYILPGIPGRTDCEDTQATGLYCQGYQGTDCEDTPSYWFIFSGIPGHRL